MKKGSFDWKMGKTEGWVGVEYVREAGDERRERLARAKTQTCLPTRLKL